MKDWLWTFDNSKSEEEKEEVISKMEDYGIGADYSEFYIKKAKLYFKIDKAEVEPMLEEGIEAIKKSTGDQLEVKKIQKMLDHFKMVGNLDDSKAHYRYTEEFQINSKRTHEEMNLSH
jgi:hypothetical protein